MIALTIRVNSPRRGQVLKESRLRPTLPILDEKTSGCDRIPVTIAVASRLRGDKIKNHILYAPVAHLAE
jgi:hypothetical protein